MKHETFTKKKSLGQHFLTDKDIAKDIVALLHADADDLIVEIGPGTGALTEYLAESGSQVLAIDVDARAVQVIEQKVQEKKWTNITVMEQDFLQLDLTELSQSTGKKLCLIGNLPYNISSPILFHVFDHRAAVKECVFMLQKEVGERIVAGPHSRTYGILSIFAQVYADVALAIRVPPTVFSPVPKVWSTVITFVMKEDVLAGIVNYPFFRKLVKQTFSMRRKMLSNGLKSMNIQPTDVPQEFKQFLSQRPEDLSVQEFIGLSNALFKNKPPEH